MNTMNADAFPKPGRWTHSFEEDHAGIRVYRPALSFPFPPARGRDSLEFHPDGACTESFPGRDDRSVDAPHQWVALGMNRFALKPASQGPSRTIEILEWTDDLLKLRLL